MDREKIEHFRERLYSEKKRVEDLIEEIQNIDISNPVSSSYLELSQYDNHPSDLASELDNKERGLAYKANEVTILKKINDALFCIEDGTYGTCSRCGRGINEERLEFLPYAKYCVKCQKELNDIRPWENFDRPVEEKVMFPPFGYGFNDNDPDEEVMFDAEDSYQSVGAFNEIRNKTEYYDDEDEYVERIEKISNQQYISQLPD